MPKQLYKNNGKSTLASSATNSATTLTIQTGDAALFASPTGGDWQMVTLYDPATGNIEVVKMTARSSATLTVVRGQEGTTGIAWSAGAVVEARLTAGMLDRIPTNQGTGSDSQIYGGSAFGSGADVIAIGRSAGSDNADAVAIGRSAAPDTVDGVAIGRNARTKILKGVAIGPDSFAAQNSVAVGSGAVTGDGSTSGTFGTAVGDQANAAGAAATAVGYLASGAGANAVALGRQSSADHDSAVAIGKSAEAAGDFGVSIGPNAFAASTSVSIGQFAYTDNARSTAIGDSAWAKVAGTTNMPGLLASIEPYTFDDDAEAFLYNGTGEWVGFSRTIDLTLNTEVSTPAIPAGVTFFVTEVGVMILEANTVSAQPSVQFGTSASNQKHVATVALSGMTARHKRTRFTPLSFDGESDLRAAVTTGATATELKGRFYWKGFAVTDAGSW